MERLIAIVGPTAVGKTRLAIDLALRLDTEIISGDALQVYRGLDIGTAKPDAAERRGVRHHLIDLLGPREEFSVADFKARAADLIAAINARGRIPILAGGTGLYVRSLLEDYRFNAAPGSEEIRRRLAGLAESRGSAHLHRLLQATDPETAARLHPNDTRRVIRALESIELSGEQISQSRNAAPVYDCLVIGLTMERAKLYERINRRVDDMVAAGLVTEVAGLLASGVPPAARSLQAIGYKELVDHLAGRADLAASVEKIKQATRNFAKRQYTWFRRMPYIHWVDVDKFVEYDTMLAYIYSLIAGKFLPGEKYNQR
ncbi:tRNA (adenosine(37)-N6)-dimethylallyltransferase MiaA [Selenomonadales bacterium 4137-cl]|uniref:tRNA dimethylallyltransferase n=1 Tax=Anaeroselena agilis TaxID=3063788 RepID=A0ABU3NYP1_9FIRM|nr:tRNA (adenosine(37)-N6)-dimethylallyltransferase MiaA [Selenomonadales bacterium 4137-cl]